MTLDFLVVLSCSVLGLVAHASRQQPWLAWVLRTLIAFFLIVEGLSAIGWAASPGDNSWGLAILAGMCMATGLLLFMPLRRALSYALAAVESVVSGRVFVPAARNVGAARFFSSEKTFVPDSMPHLVALWIYVTAFGFLLSSIEPESLKMPALPIPIPVELQQLLSYNGFGLILLAFCGIGIFVARRPGQAMTRLGLARPSLTQAGIGLALILITFAYDALWALFTHQIGGSLASKLSTYNAGTFTSGGGAWSSLVLALATGLCAGIGEETLMRGALQPVFGILPAAVLHGLLHGQFSHAPIFIVQVAGWSALMGVVRRYTNTTTTIIGHAGFNFITTFLFAFNP